MVLYKTIAEAIVDRMQTIIGNCIDSAQSAIVPGRINSDNLHLRAVEETLWNALCFIVTPSALKMFCFGTVCADI